MQLDKAVAVMEDEIREIRRALHRIPELGYEEHKTQAYIMDFLERCAPDELTRIADTGVKAVFYAENPEKVTAFRADMDALSLSEMSNAPYRSAHPGKMHACGHDGHMTILLGLAKFISKRRASLKQTVVLLFQPAEEAIGGAARMKDEGALKNPDVEQLFGLHLWPDIAIGNIGYREGPMMAQTFEFDLTIHGKSAHGASPHKGIDAIVAAADFISSIQAVLTRSIDPYEKTLITIGSISGGTMRNVIADSVEMKGTIRTFRNSVLEQVLHRIHEVLKGLEISTGVRTSFRKVMHYPVVENPVPLCEYMAQIMNYQNITVVDEIMAAEDFSYYQQDVPGLFFLLGIGAAGSVPLHNVYFDFDERALLYGLDIYRRILDLA